MLGKLHSQRHEGKKRKQTFTHLLQKLTPSGLRTDVRSESRKHIEENRGKFPQDLDLRFVFSGLTLDKKTTIKCNKWVYSKAKKF